MFLFIFESIGTSELILIGIVALIFLGPRKMPEYARKIGKLMADFRSTTNEFKETWEREVNFDEEAKAFGSTTTPPAIPVARVASIDEQADVRVAARAVCHRRGSRADLPKSRPRILRP